MSELLVQGMDFLLKSLLFLLGLVDIGLEGQTLIINYYLSLLNLLHIIFHLTLEVTFEETKQVVLDIDFLDLSVDGPQLSVNLGLLEAAQATKLPSHFDELLPLLVLFVLFALLVDLREDLRLYQVELEVHLE